jgi:hypothetical protein
LCQVIGRTTNKLKALRIISGVKARANVNVTTTEPDGPILPHSALCMRNIAMTIIFEIERLVFRVMRLTAAGIHPK